MRFVEPESRFGPGDWTDLQTLGTMSSIDCLRLRILVVVTMVTTFSLLLVNCGLNGFTEAIIQRESSIIPLQQHLSGINVISGIFLALSLRSCRDFLAGFYMIQLWSASQRVYPTTISSPAVQLQNMALLKRAMCFLRPLYTNDALLTRISGGSFSVCFVMGWKGDTGRGCGNTRAEDVALPVPRRLGCYVVAPRVPEPT